MERTSPAVRRRYTSVTTDSLQCFLTAFGTHGSAGDGGYTTSPLTPTEVERVNAANIDWARGIWEVTQTHRPASVTHLDPGGRYVPVVGEVYWPRLDLSHHETDTQRGSAFARELTDFERGALINVYGAHQKAQHFLRERSTQRPSTPCATATSPPPSDPVEAPDTIPGAGGLVVPGRACELKMISSYGAPFRPTQGSRPRRAPLPLLLPHTGSLVPLMLRVKPLPVATRRYANAAFSIGPSPGEISNDGAITLFIVGVIRFAV